MSALDGDREFRLRRLQTLFQEGQYGQVISDLTDHRDLTSEEQRLLGISALRLGQFDRAEPALLRAHLAGHVEAKVEYGNLLRATGRLEDACQHFEAVAPLAEGELALRLQRWWGVAEFQSGAARQGLARVERALHGYLQRGDTVGGAKVAVSLARMLTNAGQVARALALYQSILPDLPAQPNPLPRMTALQGWLDLMVAGGETTLVSDALHEAETLMQVTPSIRAKAHLMSTVALLHARRGEWRRYGALLAEMATMDEALKDAELSTWLAPRLAEWYAQQGRFAEAYAALYVGAPPPGHSLPPALLMARGILRNREKQYALAVTDLQAAADTFAQAGQAVQTTRAKLHHAHALYGAGTGAYLTTLLSAVEDVARLQLHPSFASDLEEVAEMVEAARLESNVGAALDSVRHQISSLRGLPLSALTGRQTQLCVHTLGVPKITLDDEQLPMSVGAVGLLTCLILKPMQTRRDLQLALYPEKFPDAAASLIKTHLRELRTALGAPAIDSQGHYHAQQYFLAQHYNVTLDLLELRDAITARNLARTMSLYKGEFLSAFEHSDWALEHRTAALSSVTVLVQQLGHEATLSGQFDRAIRMYSRLLETTPDLLDIHDLRIAAARHGENRALLMAFESERKKWL